MNNIAKAKFLNDEKSQFKKCASCLDAKKIKKLYKKNENIFKKMSLSMKDIEELHIAIFTSHHSSKSISYRDKMTTFYQEKIEELINNEGSVKELKKLIIDFETMQLN
jgi:hypothetical protein